MRLSLTCLTTFATAVVAASLPQKRFYNFQDTVVQGVNLGGWFVLEPYITPSLFQVFGDDIPVDEYHLTKKYGKEKALEVMKKHWDTWYTEDDFKDIADAGLNTVRIPIGYWAFQTLDDDPYVQGQREYLDKAIQWARNHKLNVWIDLHGAPGSQNGFDNSGLRDQIQFQTDENISLTLTVLQVIFDKYGGKDYEDVISGIEFLNEPLGPAADMNQIKNFYNWSYQNMRSVSTNNVILHDAFQQPNYWDDSFNVDQGYYNVIIDHHHYQVFSQDELARDIDDHVKVACEWGTSHKGENKWTVAGEFSAALTDCSLWLNGVGRGARWSGDYDNSTLSHSCANYLSVDKWSPEYKNNVRKYIEAQLDAFELTQGWIFWNWKTEDAIDWDMKELINAGVFPQPLSDRKNVNQCGY